MPPELLQAFGLSGTSAMTWVMIVGPVLALVLSGILALVYRASAGEAYEPDIAQAQILLACIMSLVLMVVGDSVSRAFGAVGILGVIRFRTNVKNSAEAATLLGSVAVGMACGVGMFGVAVGGTAFLCFVQALLRRVFKPKPKQEVAEKPSKGDKGKKGKKDRKDDAEALVPEADPQPEESANAPVA